MQGNVPQSKGADDWIVPRDGFDEAHRELLGDSSIQFELPPAPRPDPPDIRLNDLSGGWDIGPVLQTLFWIVIGLAAIGLLYLIVTRLAGWRRKPRGGETAEPEWHMAEQPARQLLEEADALAAGGRYSEAAHLLLHRSIEEIDQRRPASVRKALTSRDIAVLPAIPPSPAEAFGRIVRAVEHSLFGGRSLDAGDWRHCREAYERFAFAREWQS
jgi:hypothetical protein